MESKKSYSCKVLTKDELKEVGDYAKSVGFAIKIMPDNQNASFNLIHFVGVSDICVYYDVDPVQPDIAYVHIYRSGGSFDLEDTEKFLENMSDARNIAKKLLNIVI